MHLVRSRRYRPGDAKAQVDGCRSRSNDVAGAECVPPPGLDLQAVAVQADELHPPLIWQQVGLLALLEVLVADPKLATLALISAGILDDEDRTDLVTKSEQVDSHAGVEQGRTAMLQHVGQQAGFASSVDGLGVDPAVTGLQLLDAMELFHELAGHGRPH
jgi:hypothetical protein